MIHRTRQKNPGKMKKPHPLQRRLLRMQPPDSLMRGMAPFGEVCETLGIPMEGMEYETLNGYLISLIGKIPGEHEEFELDAEGWHFHVLSVRDKMIHMVRVTKA